MADHDAVVALQISRLLAAFDPPDKGSEQQEELFMQELRNAIRDFPTEAMTDGVSALIKTRRARTFPSIGDVRQHIMDQLPNRSTSTTSDMHAVYRSEDAKRDEALKTLMALPLAKRQRIVRDNAQVRVFDFVVANERLPSGPEYQTLMEEGIRVQRLMDEVSTPPGDASSTFKHITWKAAEAIRHRRAQLAERLLGQQQEAAE